MPRNFWRFGPRMEEHCRFSKSGCTKCQICCLWNPISILRAKEWTAITNTARWSEDWVTTTPFCWWLTLEVIVNVVEIFKEMKTILLDVAVLRRRILLFYLWRYLLLEISLQNSPFFSCKIWDFQPLFRYSAHKLWVWFWLVSFTRLRVFVLHWLILMGNFTRRRILTAQNPNLFLSIKSP